MGVGGSTPQKGKRITGERVVRRSMITTEETLSHLRELYKQNQASRKVILHVVEVLKANINNPPKRWKKTGEQSLKSMVEETLT